MDNNFLLEILVQELPYQFIPSAAVQLKSQFEKFLGENKLSYKNIKTYATPRRLAVLVEDVSSSQQDVIKDIKGPILTVALDKDGNYTNAAMGFAKKNGVELDSLYKKDNYIWAKVEQKGKSAKEIFEQNVPAAVMKLQGAHFMRWGYLDEKFSRPIEGVVALLNNEVLNIEIFGKKAGSKTTGHRFAKTKEITLSNPLNYVETLKQADVYADVDERKELIRKSATKLAADNNLVIDFSELEDLLDEVTYITEFPCPVICEFKPDYLKIPDIVTVTVMAVHQRYFPLYEKSGKLSNKFITMANFTGDSNAAFDNIRQGNQRVISARLEDGKFFYEEDIKTSLESKIPSLSGMTFQRGLGTLLDKTNRVIKLSDYISDMLNISDKKDILRAAKLCKADLSTKLVFEFTELQGFIGENYALKSGENENVALAIKEHYFPLGANSSLPSKIEGQIVSIADKIDTICAVFLSTQNENKKKRPTGSNDPLGIRRAVIGILRTVIANKLKINLEDVVDKALELISEEFSINIENETQKEILEFFYGRLSALYDKTYQSDVMLACSEMNPFADLSLWLERIESISEFVKSSDFSLILETINRVLKITASHKISAGIKAEIFTSPEETALYETIKNVPEITFRNIGAIKTFIEPLNNFFDKVLVMDKDENIKNNRLNLLSTLRDRFFMICDFSKIASR